MPEKKEVLSRRDLVIGAGTVALAVSATSALADERSQKKVGEQPQPQKDSPKYDAKQPTRMLHLTITLSDGSTVQLDAREISVDLGGAAKVKLLPEGLIPVSNGDSQNDNQAQPDR
jgi:hypothetical protein